MADAEELQENDASDVCSIRMNTKFVLVPKKATISQSHLSKVPQSWLEKVLKSREPDEPDSAEATTRTRRIGSKA